MLNYRELDWKLILAVLALSLIGIMLIMSAQYHADNDFQRDYYQRQSLWLGLSLLLVLVMIHLPMRLYDFSAYLLWSLSVILLIVVLLWGTARGGASRWISFGPMNLAPSDIAKMAVVLALARFLAYTKLPPNSFRRLVASILIAIIPVILILKQPDLGTALVFFVLLFFIWFWSGLSPWFLLMLISPVISLMAASHWISWAIYLVVLVAILILIKPGAWFSIATVILNLASGAVLPFFWGRLADYQKMRILTFLDPGRDPRGAGYQIIQSKIAIGSGGLWGKGFLGGSQTRLDFLPERHTDFIFSVLGEEFGLWGTLAVCALFTFILARGVMIASRCRNRFASYTVMGAVSILFFQFIVNVGMTLGFMPVTGLPLPFLSYGDLADALLVACRPDRCGRLPLAGVLSG